MSALLFPLPDTQADVVRAALLDRVHDAELEQLLKRAHEKAEERRFLPEPEPLTGFGDL